MKPPAGTPGSVPARRGMPVALPPAPAAAGGAPRVKEEEAEEAGGAPPEEEPGAAAGSMPLVCGSSGRMPASAVLAARLAALRFTFTSP